MVSILMIKYLIRRSFLVNAIVVNVKHLRIYHSIQKKLASIGYLIKIHSVIINGRLSVNVNINGMNILLRIYNAVLNAIVIHLIQTFVVLFVISFGRIMRCFGN
jgi:hypothetical protein